MSSTERIELGSNASDSFRTPKRCCTAKRLGIVAVIGIVIFAVVVGVAVYLSNRSDFDISKASLEHRVKRAEEILDKYPLVDGHNDLPWQYRSHVNNSVYHSGVNLTAGWSAVHTDIPRLRTGKVGAQFWAAFVHCNSSYKDAVRQSLDQVDVIKKIVRAYPETFEWVTTAQGIEDAFKAGKIGSLIGLEGGHSIDSSLGNLRMFYELGVRYMTVTHSCNTPWADNWLVDTPNNTAEFGGLTRFGEMVIKEMNRLGMLVDLSHVSHDTMVDAIVTSRAPVIFSHSSAFSYCNHYRNVQDDVLDMTKTNKGVVMVNFYSPYINCAPNYLNDTVNGTLSQVADHIDYIKNRIGVDYVGIGADYDGVPTLPVGLEDVSTYPALFAELLKRRWTEEDLMKLAGKNLVRVFREAERVRDTLRTEEPYEALISNVDANYNETKYVPGCRTDF
ncbi:dipeptidase 1-like [Babylonia areolata]|uniref:dipeptidase 1-like n=1 Tax=Babylonia areolata TaxID=304850 RepID=UPI003FD36B8C